MAGILKFANTLLLSVLLLGLNCCSRGGGGGSEASPGKQSNNLKIEVQSQKVSWLPPPKGKGETEAVIQFIVRDMQDNPLGTDEVDVTMLIDRQPIDPEAVISRNATELAANIRYCLVLDTSPSMVTPSREPFDNMKAGATASVNELLRVWSGNSGTADWTFSWFSDVLNLPHGEGLLPSHILNIPDPKSGEFTKLHAAVHHMALKMKDEYHGKQYAHGERDGHVMVVFSDGKDNWSFNNNSYLVPTRGELAPGVFYRTFGYRSITTLDVEKAISSHPDLVVHTIGLGNEINADVLERFSNAGKKSGRFLRGGVAEIQTLFNTVTKEFTSVQTHGAKLPLPPKIPPQKYEFTLRVTSRANPAITGEHSFEFQAGNASAGIQPRPPRILSTAVETATVNKQYLYHIEVDAYPPVTLEVWNQPAWMNFDRSKNLLYGIPIIDNFGALSEITIRATGSPVAIQEFNLDVFLDWKALSSGTSNTLNGIQGFSETDIYAVGTGGTILHYNGQWWNRLESGTSKDLHALWGSSIQNIFAVGDGDVLRYDGSSWRKVITGYLAGFNGVWGPFDNDVFVVGDSGTIMRYNGTYFQFMQSNTTKDLNGVWGIDGAEVFAVGDEGTILEPAGSNHWTSMASGTLNDLHAVWGTPGLEVVFAVGSEGTILCRRKENSSSFSLWKRMISGTQEDLWSVRGTSAHDVFAVGSKGTILHFNGLTWKKMDSWTSNDLLSVWSLRDTHVHAAGKSGSILLYRP